MAQLAAMSLLSKVALGATVLATGATVIAQQNAAKQIEIDSKVKAQQEKDASVDRELERRRRLVSALASQNAEAGAMGVSGSSRAALAMTDIRNANRDSLADRASTTRKALILKSQGKQARSQANLQSVATIFNSTAGAAEAFG